MTRLTRKLREILMKFGGEERAARLPCHQAVGWKEGHILGIDRGFVIIGKAPGPKSSECDGYPL